MTAEVVTLGQEESGEPGVSHISHSQLSKYLTCPEQYRLHYLERLRRRVPSANLAFGSVVHDALASLFRSGEDPVAAFQAHWASLREIELDYSRKGTWDKLRQAGEVLLARFALDAMPRLSNIAAVEKRFELSITSLDLPLVGIVDLVADIDGTRTVIDFKSATRAYERHEVVLSDQLTCYQLADPEASQVAFCVLIKRKEPKIEWHVSKRSPAELAEYLAKIAHVARETAAGNFYKRPGMWCTWCDFLPVCMGDHKRIRETLIQVR
ncbi:MAG TPA: PD-(D/E)XK nuclease family protein [Candidatus Polarisedimenticolaceae bacterium]|nr:PD-(D/E)XK nuclease family protein [Candidatus Polarisedimenticolaceae bacterium]